MASEIIGVRAELSGICGLLGGFRLRTTAPKKPRSFVLRLPSTWLRRSGFGMERYDCTEEVTNCPRVFFLTYC